jgi:hypothetical protein
MTAFHYDSKWRYQLDKRTEPPAVQLWGVAHNEREGARGGFIRAGQGYTYEDKLAVYRWLEDRAAGYADVLWRERCVDCRRVDDCAPDCLGGR